MVWPRRRNFVTPEIMDNTPDSLLPNASQEDM